MYIADFDIQANFQLYKDVCSACFGMLPFCLVYDRTNRSRLTSEHSFSRHDTGYTSTCTSSILSKNTSRFYNRFYFCWLFIIITIVLWNPFYKITMILIYRCNRLKLLPSSNLKLNFRTKKLISRNANLKYCSLNS